MQLLHHFNVLTLGLYSRTIDLAFIQFKNYCLNKLLLLFCLKQFILLTIDSAFIQFKTVNYSVTIDLTFIQFKTVYSLPIDFAFFI